MPRRPPTSTLFPYTTLFRSAKQPYIGHALPKALPMIIWHLRRASIRSEEHTSELQSRVELVCRLLLEKKKAPFGHRDIDFLLANYAYEERSYFKTTGFIPNQ